VLDVVWIHCADESPVNAFAANATSANSIANDSYRHEYDLFRSVY